MHRFLSVLAIPCIAFADVGSEVREWYRLEFFPQFESSTSPDARVLKRLYTDGHILHGASGRYVSPNTVEWWSAWLNEFVDSGWTGSQLVGTEATVLNSTTVALVARWRRNGATKENCHWYLVSKHDGWWRITNEVEGFECPAR